MSKRELDDFEIDVLVRMSKGGSTDVQIANVLGCTDYVVKTARQKLGLRSLNARDVVPWTRDEEDHLMAMVAAGLPNVEIAEKLGRPQDSVWGKRRILGLMKPVEERKNEGERIVFASVSRALRYPPMQVDERDPFELDAQLRVFALAMREGGHKYGAGERPVESDRRVPVRFSTPLTHSPIGSSAAACVD